MLNNDDVLSLQFECFVSKAKKKKSSSLRKKMFNFTKLVLRRMFNDEN